jgi:hypothetical protein
MKWIIIISTIGVPLILYTVAKFYERVTLLYNLVAVLCAWIFGAIAANSVYEILRDKTVFMTNIHAIFLNAYFLFAGAYLGVYMIYLLILYLLKI